MVEPNLRFSILMFPQFFDGNILKLNIVFLPRNQNPLQPAIEGEGPTIPDARPFADANLRFVAKVVSDDATSASSSPSLPTSSSSPTVMVPLNTLQPSNARLLFEALATQFKIDNKNAHNTNLNINAPLNDRAPDPVAKERSVKKYLPNTYRKSFNFVAPRTPNAVIDDSYHCELRDSKPSKDFVQSPDKISWGKVFAHAMRQPLLAQSLGMIFETELAVDNEFFSNGGWLYVDLADDSDYKAQQNASLDFIKIYAARIPRLEQGVARSVFAAVQFPVSLVAPPGNYDEIFIECANYDDGFAKVVHSFQPVSNNMLQEESDGFHPTKEAGIRLGWDDEQILIWYMRQLMEDSSVGPKKRIDAPIGVFGFKIDVREKSSSNLPQQPWQSLNLVQSRDVLKVVNLITSESIILGSFMKELAYQVYPSKMGGSNSNKSFWLPMYFASWNGKSMVLPDDDAVKIYHNDHQDVIADPSTNVKGAYSNGLNKIYQAGPLATQLQYGKLVEFRVRLSDMSHGGPGVDAEPIHNTQSQIATCHFKRFIAPNAVRLDNVLIANSDDENNYFRDPELKIRRPLLGYPSVLFTGKYANAIDRLKQASADMAGKEAFGIADPDVESIEIAVEVAGLKMDNLKSISGREPYLFLYSTTRKFPANSASSPSPSFDDLLTIPVEFKDCNILNFDNSADLGDLGVIREDIDSMDKLILPTARTIRLTIRAVCEKRSNYYGLEGDSPDNNTRYGKTIQFLLYQPSKDERNLFANTSVAKKIQGIYLRPDPTWVHDSNLLTRLRKNEDDQDRKTPDLIQRLAQQLGLENSGLTITGKKGQRVQFGCSNRIRHILSPDNSSITFGSKGDLINHWLCCITLQIERDWSWDALQDRSFVIKRKKRFRDDDENTETELLDVGDIEIKKTISFNALQKPERSRTTVVFIDAVEAKNELRQRPPNDSIPRFPDLIEPEYNIETFFKQDHATMHRDSSLSLQLELPITIPPAQVPKIVSAGIALSPYIRNKKYSATEPRRRFLWIEFEEPVRDPKDNYFARALTYAPDQLISNNHPELLLDIPEEPALAIDPEYIRVITPNQPHDNMGIDAMQPMERATNSDRHYLLPLPPGLHSESPEMFGFFTYEFRIGHYRFTDSAANHSEGEYVWTTAQGRFGRALRISGIQHPAPTLTCIVNRDEEKLYVTAPYAVAVSNGKNVTADPPRTDIWCLLYAQVRQADNKDFRNILLDDKILDWRVRVEYKKEVNWNVIYTEKQRAALKQVAIRNWKDEIEYGNFRHVYKLAESEGINKDSSKYGTVIWSNSEVTQLLDLYGLPHDSSLSVLCVELLPQITNIHEHVSPREARSTVQRIQSSLVGDVGFISAGNLNEERQLASRRAAATWIASFNENEKPLSNRLGHYRILRTSPLTEVPFICCVDCGYENKS